MSKEYYVEDNGNGYLEIYDPYDAFVIDVATAEQARILLSHLNNPGVFTSMQDVDGRFNILDRDGVFIISVNDKEGADGLLSHLNR